MTNQSIHIIRAEISNFKNIDHGCIKFCNYNSAISTGLLNQNDIMGIYGENGSGKTAMVEAFSVLQSILQERPISQSQYHLFNTDATTEIIFTGDYGLHG